MPATLCDDWLAVNKAEKRPNPMIKRCGRGPDGKKCKTCRHFYRKSFAKTYRKCALRGDTNGPGTDHLANWPACGEYGEESCNTSTE